MSKRVLVYGAGGHGKVVANVAQRAGLVVTAFVDDGPGRDGTEFFDAPVVSWARVLGEFGRFGGIPVALAIGDNAIRERIHARISDKGFRTVTLLHDRAVVARSARIGEGTVVMACAVVNPDASIGPGAILNTSCVVEHDCEVGAYAHLSPSAALGGTVMVGRRVHLGIGAVVLPGLNISDDTRVGAGAVVTRDITERVTVVGVPARVLQPRPDRRVPLKVKQGGA